MKYARCNCRWEDGVLAERSIDEKYSQCPICKLVWRESKGEKG